jgi:hypothetical protein
MIKLYAVLIVAGLGGLGWLAIIIHLNYKGFDRVVDQLASMTATEVLG